MASKIKLINENGKVLELSSGYITLDKQLDPKDFKYIKDTMKDMLDLNGKLEDGDVVFLKGYHTVNDGGGGTFMYNPLGSKSDHNGGTIIDPSKTFPEDWGNQNSLNDWFNTTNSGEGILERIYNGNVDVSYFGAKGDGNTDDTLAIQTAIKLTDITIDNNSYYIKDILYIYNNIYGNNTTLLSDSGLYVSTQNKIIVKGLNIKYNGNDNTGTIGLYSTYLSTHYSIFEDIIIDGFETNLLIDTWNNRYENIVTKNAKYGVKIVSKTGSNPNLLTISNVDCYYCSYGMYLDTTNIYNIDITDCNIEHCSVVGIYSNDINLLLLNSIYLENNTKCLDINNTTITLNNIKYDHIYIDNSKVYINNFIRFYDKSAVITNSIISLNTSNSLYRFLNTYSNKIINNVSNKLNKYESYGYLFNSRYGSSLSFSFTQDTSSLLNRNNYVIKISRKDANNKGATSLYIPIPKNINKNKVFVKIRAKGVGNFAFTNNLCDLGYSQFDTFNLTDSFEEIITELDFSNYTDAYLGIRFSYNEGDYIIVDGIGISDEGIPSIYSNKEVFMNAKPSSTNIYALNGDIVYNNNCIEGEENSWTCHLEGNPGGWSASSFITDSGYVLKMNNLPTSDPNVAGQLYVDSNNNIKVSQG